LIVPYLDVEIKRGDTTPRQLMEYRSGWWMKRKVNGECIALDSEKRECKIYKDRPKECRDFTPDHPICKLLKKSEVNVMITHHPIKGRCVIAVRPFKKSERIETNHVLIFPILPSNNKLMDWAMEWNKKEDAIALGNINLLNHSKKPNVTVKNNYRAKTKSIYAVRNIKKGEELVTNYECPLWFKPCKG